MAKSTKNTAAAKNAAAVNTNTNNANTAAVVENTNNNANATNADANNEERAQMSPTDCTAAAVDLVRKYGTISNIRNEYATLVNEYGKKNFDAVLNAAKELRAKEIRNASDNLNSAVFTYNGITAAVFRAVATQSSYAELCKFARREYAGTDAERAAAVIRDYYSNVNANGAPLCRVSYINAAGTEIYAVYEEMKLTHTNAVSILKTALDNMAKTATNAATKKDGNDNAAAVRANVRVTGTIIAVYAAAIDENEHATNGTRRDNSKDERTRKNAAAVMGKTLPIGAIRVSIWNAAANGNEDAADIVAAAKERAKEHAADNAAKGRK